MTNHLPTSPGLGVKQVRVCTSVAVLVLRHSVVMMDLSP